MEDAKTFSAAAPGIGGDGFRHGAAFDLRELGGVFALMGLATKDDIREIRAEFKAEIREVRAETKRVEESLREETKRAEESLRAEVRGVRDELKADIREVRAEINDVREEIGEVRVELNSRIDKVQEELHGIKGLVAKWLIGTIIAVIGTMIAQTTLILSGVRLPG
jgi:ElaB/YqjD/DUF883 family membrane-anchored ribosome-binding protein